MLIACGGVSRDYSQERQSYLTAVFVNPDFNKKGIGRKLVEFLETDEWCLDSKLIEVPSSKSSHKFYYRCGCIKGRRARISEWAETVLCL